MAETWRATGRYGERPFIHRLHRPLPPPPPPPLLFAGSTDGPLSLCREVCAVEGHSDRFQLRNKKENEFLYVGSSALDAESHLALTWIGAINGDPGAVWQIPGMAAAHNHPEQLRERANDPFRPNARAILRLADQLAAEQRCQLVGTEHLLLALLTFRTDAGLCTTARWLESATGQSVEALAAVAREFAATTAGAAANGRRSRSLARGVELGCAIAQPAQTEHLLLGLLLAAELDGQPNAATRICAERGVDTTALQQAFGVSAAQLVQAGRACPGGIREFGLDWGEPVPAAAAAAAAAVAPAAPPANMRGPVPNTHYVYPNLICGKSAVRKNDFLEPFLSPCYTRNSHFAKIGSGQT